MGGLLTIHSSFDMLFLTVLVGEPKVPRHKETSLLLHSGVDLPLSEVGAHKVCLFWVRKSERDEPLVDLSDIEVLDSNSFLFNSSL